MSAPSLAPAPLLTTAPSPAPRRPAATRAEEPASFAEVMDTASAEASPPARAGKTSGPTEDGAKAVEPDAPATTDAAVSADAVLPAPAPVIPLAEPIVAAPVLDDQAGDTAEATDPSSSAPAATGTIPAPPPAAPAAAPLLPPPAPVSVAPSAAPVAPAPAPAPAPTVATQDAAPAGEQDPATEGGSPPLPPPPASSPAGTRAATTPDSGNAAVSSGAAETGSAPNTASPPAPTPSPSASAASGAGAPKTAAETPTPVLAALESHPDSPQPAQTASAPPAAPAEVSLAATTGLSTLSLSALDATAQIAAQIARKLEGRSTRFEMALTPDDLGRVDISLDIDADGQLSARLAFDNPIAAADLKGRVEELRRQLTDAGFTVADDALSFEQREPSAGNGGAFDRGSDRHSARAFGAASRLAIDADAALNLPRWISLTLTPERVDMKV